MSMPEEQSVSPEATVAAGAAAAAVEELHERQEIDQASAEASAAAQDANANAQDAMASSDMAVSAAIDASDTAQTAIGTAAEAQVTAEAAAEVALTTDQRLERLLDIIEAERATKEAQPTVEEVPVNDAAKRDNATTEGDDSNASSSGSETVATKAREASAEDIGPNAKAGRANGLRRRRR